VQVSVIMPVYNAGNCKHLDIAVNSILDQHIENMELIICDDMSTDGTWNWLHERSGYERVTLVRNPRHAGAGTARNTAIRLATGKYIALMDSDDVSMPGRLQAQVDFLEGNPELSFVGTKGSFFCESLGDMGKDYWFVKYPQPADFLMTLPFVHASIMFRKEPLMEIGGYNSGGWVTRSEDYDLLMRLYARGYRGANLSQSLYSIRLNDNTYCRRKYRYRFCECMVKLRGFQALGLMPGGMPYAVKPLVVGLIPGKLLEPFKEKYYKKRE